MTITGAEPYWGLISAENGPVTGLISGDRLELRSASGKLHFLLEVRGDEMVGTYTRSTSGRVTLQRQESSPPESIPECGAQPAVVLGRPSGFVRRANHMIETSHLTV